MYYIARQPNFAMESSAKPWSKIELHRKVNLGDRDV